MAATNVDVAQFAVVDETYHLFNRYSQPGGDITRRYEFCHCENTR